MLESEKVKINEFKDVYSSIDSKIYKLKVNSWLDSNRNNLIDFNNEISMKYLLSAMENLRVGMKEIRTVLRNVKPKDRTITIENIKKLLLEFQYNSGIKTHFHLEGEVEKLGVKRLIVIEENIKEALTNTLKYSKASQINVSILIYNKVARIEIKDNGQGSSNIKKGLGLIGMEERLEKINGNMKIDGSDGFTLNMILNLEDKYD